MENSLLENISNQFALSIPASTNRHELENILEDDRVNLRTAKAAAEKEMPKTVLWQK